MTGERPRLGALSAIRFLAISHVVLFHVGDRAMVGAPALLERVRQNAHMLMPLFFVLSGFVLTYSYLESLRTETLARKAFWVSRLTRLLPVYLVALGLQFTVDTYVNRGVPPRYVAGTVAQALMVQGWAPPLVWYGNPPGWTVCVEAFFYLVFPWLVVRLSRERTRRAVAVAAIAWVLGQLVSLAYVGTRPDGWPPPSEPGAFYLDLLRYLPPLHLPSFIIGIVAALAFLDDVEERRQRPGRLIALLGFLPILACLLGALQALSRNGIGVLSWPFPFTHNGFLAPAWAVVVYGLAHAGTSAKLLSARPLVRLGEASYGLYILHFPIYNAVVTWLVPAWDDAPWFLLQFFALVVPLSVVCFERFEQPVRAVLVARLLGDARRRRAAETG